jgi:organic hydroperoxide reductase OsmC/OhrA
MVPFPHHYRVHASAAVAGAVRITAAGVPPIETQAPPEFGGPEGFWSPEALLVGAIADCFVLSFRAGARAARLDWDELSVDAEGTLERANGVTRFVRFSVLPRLGLRNSGDIDKAHAALERAHRSCLVTNSLAAPCILVPQVVAPETAVLP